MRTKLKVLYFLPLLLMATFARAENETAITDGALQQVELGTVDESTTTVNKISNSPIGNATRRIKVTNNGIQRVVQGVSYSSWTSGPITPSVGFNGASITTQAVNVGNSSSNTWVFDVAWASAPVLYKGFTPSSGWGTLQVFDCRGDTASVSSTLIWKGVVTTTATNTSSLSNFNQWISSGLMITQDGNLSGTHQWERTDRIKRR